MKQNLERMANVVIGRLMLATSAALYSFETNSVIHQRNSIQETVILYSIGLFAALEGLDIIKYAKKEEPMIISRH